MTRLILIIASFSLAITLVVGWVWPEYQDLRFLKQEIEQTKMDLRRKEEYLEQLRKLGEELKKYQSQLAKIDSALPFDPSLEILVNFLQKTASQSGLVLKKIEPPVTQKITKEETKGKVSAETKEKELELKQTTLSFMVSGDYSSFRKFLLALENSARLIEVQKISFFPPEEGLHNFELRIKVYSY